MPRGTISLVFDDGYEHILSTVVPLLNARQLPGVFAIPLEGAPLAAAEKLPVASPEAWMQACRASPVSHELAAHGIRHLDLTTLTIDQLRRELERPQQALAARTLVYPGGAYNEQVVREAQHFYTAARGVKRGIEALPARDPMRLTTYSWTRRNWSLARANAVALAAWITNRWLIETFHIIDDSSNALHSVPHSSFIRHLDFISRLPIPIRTIQETIAKT